MIYRSIEPRLVDFLRHFPAVGLIGPRQVGKTTLAQSLTGQLNKPIRYFDLERLEDYNRLQRDAGFFLEQFQEECVIIDEVQRLPGLFAELRSLIDRRREPGRFLLLGSASPLLLRNTSDSLAGRIGYLTLSPFHLTEVVEESQNLRPHWLRGGFPESWLASSDEWSFQWRENFIRTYVERDLQFLGLQADPIRFRTFLQMLAAVSANLWNAEALGRSIGVSGSTLKNYLQFLESSFFVRVLRPFFININKRLVKSPKVYLADTGLLHALLGIRAGDQLLSSPHVGASWETYAVNQIIPALPEGLEAYFYRTSDGTECDLVLVRGLTPVACVEIKFSNTPALSKGLLNTIDTLQTKHNYLLTFSSDTYRLRENVQVMNLEQFVRALPSLAV